MSATEEIEANCLDNIYESNAVDNVGMLKDITNVSLLTNDNNVETTMTDTKEMSSYQNKCHQHRRWNEIIVEDKLNESCDVSNASSSNSNSNTNHIGEFNSDNESLHSVDTFSYIKTSRMKCNSFRQNHKVYKRTIKTFRLVPSQRDKLREKYASSEHDETLLLEIRLRRAKALSSRNRHDSETVLSNVKNQRKLKYRNRQKFLRKQKSHFEKVRNISSSSSGTEDETLTKHQVKPIKNYNYRRRNFVITRKNRQQKLKISTLPSTSTEKYVIKDDGS